MGIPCEIHAPSVSVVYTIFQNGGGGIRWKINLIFQVYLGGGSWSLFWALWEGWPYLSCPTPYKSHCSLWKTDAAFIIACSLTLCSVNAACSFIVNTKRCCRNGERRRSRVEVIICTVSKAARLLIYWQNAAYRLVISERQVESVQLHKYNYQSSKQ